jgi:hypothetical protein
MQPAHNHFLAANLADLLEERKSVKNAADLEKVCKRHDVDVAKLQTLAHLVNTPTVDPESVVKTLDTDGNETVSMKVFGCCHCLWFLE